MENFMVMGKFILFAMISAVCSGLSWWSYVLAQVDPQNRSLWEIVQLGGTGGLVTCLLAAVVSLWRDRKEQKKDLDAARSLILQAQVDTTDRVMRLNEAHREDIIAAANQHKADIAAVTDRLLAEMASQIEAAHKRAGDIRRSNE